MNTVTRKHDGIQDIKKGLFFGEYGYATCPFCMESVKCYTSEISQGVKCRCGATLFSERAYK